MHRVPPAILLVAIFTVLGCAKGPATDLHFHSLALTFHLPYPSYLVGIEKADADLVGRVPFGTCQPDATLCLNRDAAYLQTQAGQEWRDTLARRLDDEKQLFVSHIVTYEQTSDQGSTPLWRGRLLSSLYQDDGTLTCAKSPEHSSPTCIPQSIEILKALKTDLEQRIDRERATHVLLYSTGWNSDQVDSIRRYRKFFGRLMETAEKDHPGKFRPIFIGLTWPADWPELPGYSDILNKKNDADEAAVTWVNYLLNQILLPLKAKHVKIVAVGHSFGGRIVTTAANSRDLLPKPVSDRINLVVGLQAAFSIKRFGGGTEGDPFTNFKEYADKFVFVSSRNDEAGRAGWVLAKAFNAILGEEGIREAQKGELAGLFEVIAVNQSGKWVQDPRTGPERALLLDASAIVRDHNDVNNEQVGHLLWTTIKTFAP
jgi:hypothetical protein